MKFSSWKSESQNHKISQLSAEHYQVSHKLQILWSAALMKVKENASFETETCKFACGFGREMNKK